MPAPADLPPPAQLLALAHAALLDQLDRHDAGHALACLLGDLARATGRQAWLEDTPPGSVDEPAVLRDGHTLCLPLRRLEQPLGRLCLRPADGLSPGPTAAALAAVTDTLAALCLQRQAQAPHVPVGDSAAARGQTGGALVRAALRGAGTFVWEWHIPSDRLGDIDEGLDMLGHAPRSGPHRQADWDALIHPDDREANHAAYLRHERGEAPVYEHTYRARAGDGSWRWLLERGRIVERTPDGAPLRMVGVQADITEQRRAEAEASDAVQRLGRIAAHVPGALFQYQIDADGGARFPYISERSLALFGVSPAEMAQDASAMLRRVHPDQRQTMIDGVLEAARSLRPWVQEFQVRRPDGETRWIRGSSSPLCADDGRVLWHGYFEDMTAWHTLARADHDRQVAQAASRAKSQFLSRMSHELRTPLNAVLGFAQLMGLDQSAPLQGEQPRRLAMVRQSGEHLLAMIEDLLDLTSIEAGHLPLAPEAVPLGPLADDALAMVQAAAPGHGLVLQRQGDGALRAWADRKRLRQVLINLLSNAVKYNRPGGQVRLVLRRQADQVVMEVHDTGAGLTPAQCARLFEPFNRLGQAHGPIQGTGIGLTVTRHLVQLMGGQITVQSTPGVGSCFTVSLPASPP